MGLTLLHHSESELSRALLSTLPSGAAVVDCSNGLPQGYAGPAPSAFPSVVVQVPAYVASVDDVDSSGAFRGLKQITVPAHDEALRMPASWDAVGLYIKFVNARSASK